MVGRRVGAAAKAGERYWQIPLVDDYVTEMDSWYADLQNAGTAEGSLVKSGLFLREFVTDRGPTSTSAERPTSASPCRSRRAARPG